MKRISSDYTAWMKWGTPALMTGGLAIIAWLEAHSPRGGSPVFWAFLAVLGIASLAVYAWYYFPLADSVDDAGDVLVVRRRGVEERVALDNVMLVELHPGGRGKPPRVALQLRTPGRLGGDIVFVPQFGMMDAYSGKNRQVEELQDRALRARGAAREEVRA